MKTYLIIVLSLLFIVQNLIGQGVGDSRNIIVLYRTKAVEKANFGIELSINNVRVPILPNTVITHVFFSTTKVNIRGESNLKEIGSKQINLVFKNTDTIYVRVDTKTDEYEGGWIDLSVKNQAAYRKDLSEIENINYLYSEEGGSISKSKSLFHQGPNYSSLFISLNDAPVGIKAQSGCVYDILLNNQLVSTLESNQYLEYTFKEEGRLNIAIAAGPLVMSSLVINVVRAQSYHYNIDCYGKITKLSGGAILKSARLQKAQTIEPDPTRPIIRANDSFGPSSGTGFLVSTSGMIITNYHVIEKTKSISVKGINGDFSNSYPAEIVAFDIPNDLALLKIKNVTISDDSLPYNFSAKPSKQGEDIYVLGYPMTTNMGEEIKITSGLINASSGYKGSISHYQFSAPVQPGNSGCPLFSKDGSIVGVVNSKLSGAESVGYAIKNQYLNTFLELSIPGFKMPPYSKVDALSLSEKVESQKKFIYIISCE